MPSLADASGSGSKLRLAINGCPANLPTCSTACTASNANGRVPDKGGMQVHEGGGAVVLATVA
ncbi:MAG: hypothetical protein R6W76_05500 [Caldilinea sp.]